MGIFDFVRDAGKEKVAEQVNTNLSDVLAKKLQEYGLEVKGVNVELKGDVVTVKGEAADQATKEKVVMALGNLKGVSQVDDQMTLPANYVATREPVFYTVVSGDSLSKIAKKHYGDAMKYPIIFEANKPMLKDANLIYPGQVLRIPEMEA
jgi:nucleoid-associated protein YgaU